MASKLSVCFLALLFTSAHLAFCKLDPNYYAKTCPQLHHIVATGLKTALKTDPRIAASLLRLHYTDCFVDGCEASVLLDDAKGVKGEKNAVQNRNSLRGFEVIDHIKAKVEKACPSTVSCADILTLAAKESVVASGGPSWAVQLGRRDGRAASEKAANEQLPAPSESIVAIYNKFKAKGLNATDLLILSASHTIGFARCSSFRYRADQLQRHGQGGPQHEPQAPGGLAGGVPQRGRGQQALPAGPRDALQVRPLLLQQPAEQRGRAGVGPVPDERPPAGVVGGGLLQGPGAVFQGLLGGHGQDGQRGRDHRAERAGQEALQSCELSLKLTISDSVFLFLSSGFVVEMRENKICFCGSGKRNIFSG